MSLMFAWSASNVNKHHADVLKINKPPSISNSDRTNRGHDNLRRSVQNQMRKHAQEVKTYIAMDTSKPALHDIILLLRSLRNS
jgi:hypothetical protein